MQPGPCSNGAAQKPEEDEDARHGHNEVQLEQFRESEIGLGVTQYWSMRTVANPPDRDRSMAFGQALGTSQAGKHPAKIIPGGIKIQAFPVYSRRSSPPSQSPKGPLGAFLSLAPMVAKPSFLDNSLGKSHMFDTSHFLFFPTASWDSVAGVMCPGRERIGKIGNLEIK